ncbi:MAG: NUDIX hydrolase N-terminal domain-containing protein [Janthinobacterium lividum]
MNSTTILNYAKRLKTMAHLGLTYASNAYEVERYQELEQISLEIMNGLTGQPLETLSVYFESKKEYITPKTDVRAVIFNERKEILLVKEKADKKWSLPGGWADIGLSPAEVAVKEVLEETGFNVQPKKLLAILDKRCHPHPPQLDYVYKIFIHCEIVAGLPTAAFDILDTGFFVRNAIPELSLDRVLPTQIDLMFEYLNNLKKEAIVD